jgi:hypothetical protein
VQRLGNISLKFGPLDVQVKLHTITCFQRSPRFRTTLSEPLPLSVSNDLLYYRIWRSYLELFW